MKIEMPEGAKQVLDQLHGAGYEAYVVGGCVRDALLGRVPDDWDITTNANPVQVKSLFEHTIDTGLQHGTVTVMIGKEGYEVTTYRIDGEYTDHRRPTEVTFTSDLKEDMLRRDFTINAMAYNVEDGLVDHFHGQEDLEDKIIRCVGVATERFDEDALRVLRALRFSAQLDFSIEEETLAAMKEQARFLQDVSAERIRVELTKLLVSNHPKRLLTVGVPCEITKYVMPWFDEMLETPQENPHHRFDVGRHCMEATLHVRNDACMRFAALLHDVGKPASKTVDENGVAHFYKHGYVGADIAKKIMRELKFDNDTTKRVRELIYWHDYNWGNQVSMNSVRRAMNKVGPDYIDDLIELQRADVLAQSDYLQKEKLALLCEIETNVAKVREQNQCVQIKDLALNGKDLIALGMKPGKALGETLNWLLEQVIEHPGWNEKGTLRALVIDYMKQS